MITDKLSWQRLERLVSAANKESWLSSEPSVTIKYDPTDRREMQLPSSAGLKIATTL